MPEERMVLIGADCDAYGHPTECQEPAPGTVERTSSHDVTIDGTEIATKASAEQVYPSHAHDYSAEEGCHDMQSHSIDVNDTHSVTINGSSVYLFEDEGTDPGTGSRTEHANTGGNSAVTVTD